MDETQINYDKKNYRKHDDKNKRIIKKSLEELGAGRSILIDSENTIIAGNGVKEAWGNKPVKIIESDGTELIIVKRTDLKTLNEKRKTLALIDNHASDTSDFDNDLINEDFDSDELNDWDFDIPDYAAGIDANNMTDNDVDLDQEFDPIGNSDGLQRVVFIFDDKDEAESYLKSINISEFSKKG